LAFFAKKAGLHFTALYAILDLRPWVGAISRDGEASQQMAVSLGASAKAGSGCGLCQSGVPCEYKNPRNERTFSTSNDRGENA
jgi:hypothetical protein